MDDVGDVGRGAARGKIRGLAQRHDLILLRHRIHGQILAFEHKDRFAVKVDAGQHLLVADAAARIGVDLVDQVRDRALAVADDVARRALGRGDEFAVDHEQAMVVAGEIGLDDDRVGMFLRGLEAGDHVFVLGDRDRDAAAVVAVVRLGHDRAAEPARGAQGGFLGAHEFLLRHWKSERSKNLVRLFLVAGEFDCDMRRASRDRGLNALLVLAVAELHERLLVHAQPRNAALLGGAHERCGRRSERAALCVADELVARFGEIPAFGHAVLRPQVFRQQRGEQA